MSPVSRGRRRKPGRKPKPQQRNGRARIAPPRPSRPGWFTGAIARVLAGAESLAGVSGPRELDQGAAELVGAELERAVRGGSALRLGQWLTELVEAVEERVDDPDPTRRASALLLLHGLAGQIDYPAEALHDARHRAAVEVPDWLPATARVRATGEVHRLRDAYGTRFGVVAEFGYPGDRDRHWYLLDIDASSFVLLRAGGLHDTLDAAAAAWREQVGEAGAGVAVEVVTSPAELDCVAHLSLEEFGIRGDEPRAVLDEWFRAHERVVRLRRALHARGMPLSSDASLYRDVDAEVLAGPFRTWYRVEFGRDPDDEALDALAGEWMEGSLPETWWAVSPERVRFHRALIGDWIADDPITAAVLALLPVWVRRLADRAQLSDALRERVLAEVQDLAGG